MSTSADTQHDAPGDRTRPKPADPADTTGSIADVERACLGDADSFGLLYGRYRNYVFTIIMGDIKDPHTQNDLLQATFERAWTKLDSLRDPAAFKPWLAQIARRLVIDHHRSSSRVVQTDFGDQESGDDLVAEDWSADEWASMRELATAVDAGIANLSARDAAVLELSSTFGFTAGEIAAALDVDTGHARVLVHRARQRLRAAVFPTEPTT